MTLSPYGPPADDCLFTGVRECAPAVTIPQDVAFLHGNTPPANRTNPLAGFLQVLVSLSIVTWQFYSDYVDGRRIRSDLAAEIPV